MCIEPPTTEISQCFDFPSYIAWNFLTCFMLLTESSTHPIAPLLVASKARSLHTSHTSTVVVYTSRSSSSTHFAGVQWLDGQRGQSEFNFLALRTRKPESSRISCLHHQQELWCCWLHLSWEGVFLWLVYFHPFSFFFWLSEKWERCVNKCIDGYR